MDVDNKKLIAKRKDLIEKLAKVDLNLQKESEFANKRYKHIIKTEIQEIHAIKLKIEDQMPLYKNYCLISKDLAKVENIDNNRKTIKKGLLDHKQKEAKDKIRKLEDKLNIRVALLATEQKNTLIIKKITTKIQERIDWIKNQLSEKAIFNNKVEIKKAEVLSSIDSKMREIRCIRYI